MRALGIAIGFIAIFATLTAPALAQTSPLEDLENDCAITNIWCGTGSGGVTCNKSVYDGEGSTTNVNACDFCDALIVVRNVTVMLMWLSTIAATLMIVVGALMMMLAAGSEERFAKGKTTMLNAVIGMAIALTAWLFVNVVLQFLSGNPDLPWNTINCA